MDGWGHGSWAEAIDQDRRWLLSHLPPVAEYGSTPFDGDLACFVPDALLGALEHVAVVAEVFLVDFNDDIGGTKDAPRIIDTTSIVFDCSELVLIEGAIHVDGAVFALDEARLLLARPRVGVARGALSQDVIVVVSGHEVSDLFVGQGLHRASHTINQLARNITETWRSSNATVIGFSVMRLHFVLKI